MGYLPGALSGALALTVLLGFGLASACRSISPPPLPDSVRSYTYRVVASYPHDPAAFTQGLAFEGATLFEGTGLHGQSTLRRVTLETGAVLQERQLAREFFGEGITVFGDEIVQLTWQQNTGFVYDKASLQPRRQFTYPGEGWGLTHDGKRLIMSDGTAGLRFLDPDTLQETGRVQVTDDGLPVIGLNELEYVRGRVFANVWPTHRVVIIAPETGRVVAWLDLDGLLGQEYRQKAVDVLNGIAYMAGTDRLFVTGKLWPRLFEIRLVPRK